MSIKYKFDDNEGVYFVTSTVVDWIDVFTHVRFSSDVELLGLSDGQSQVWRPAPVRGIEK